MNGFSLLACLLMLACVISMAGAETKAAKPTANGTWHPISADLSGKAMPEAVLKTMTLEIKDNDYTVTVGKAIDRGTVKLNDSANPKTLDILGTEGPNKGKTILCIYELDGDTFKVCYDLSGKARPTAFESKPDTQLFLVTYKRSKP